MKIAARLKALKIAEQDWRYLHARTNRDWTLREIADSLAGGVSRERIRQRLKATIRRLDKGLLHLAPIFDVLESHASAVAPDESWSVEQAAQWTAKMLHDYYPGSMEGVDGLRLVAALRALAQEGPRAVTEWWPKATYLLCIATPAIRAHHQVAQELERREEQKRKLSYEELAVLVLEAEGEPLHWQEIAYRAEALKRRPDFSERTLYNAIVHASDTFVRTDSGTYGLRKWGLESSEHFTDIIASILREIGHAASEGQIYQMTQAIRPVRRPTLLLTLDLNPRFYLSINGLYGLRAWLPPRHKQNLRTPQWLIEDSKSFERVQRAVDRGYDVDAIVERDRMLQGSVRGESI